MDIESCYYQVHCESNLLRVRLLRTWDHATTLAFCQLFDRYIRDELQHEWTMIADLTHWCLDSEAACDVIYKHHKQCIALGLKYQAIILPKSNLKRWRIRAFVADDYTVKTVLADSELHAIAWLVAQGRLDKKHMNSLDLKKTLSYYLT